MAGYRRTRKHARIMMRVEPRSRTRRLETLVMWALFAAGFLLMLASVALPSAA